MTVEHEIAASDQDQKGSLITFGAVGGLIAAIGTLSCCVAPLALFSLGVSGAWIGNLTALSPYQPYFIAAAALLIGVGFWQVYRKPKLDCADGTYCARPASRIFIKAVLWVSVALVITAIAYNYAAPYILSTN